MWSLVVRKNPLYLPLAATFDQTLASIGKKTRTNLRYYRRRAEKDLGCSFTANLDIKMDEFIQFNRQCAFPVSDEIARWRFQSLSMISRSFLQGVRDGEGRLLSIASGRRTGDQTVLEWQCNRADLPSASISTVMRAYLIEHEVSLGMTRLYFEGGTPSSLQQSFVEEGAADLTLYKQSAYVWLVRRLAGKLFPPKNYLAQILTDRKLAWTKFLGSGDVILRGLMSWMRGTVVAGLALAVTAAWAAGTNTVIGDWKTPGGSVVRAEWCETAICLKVVKISPTSRGTTDAINPDTQLFVVARYAAW